MELEIITAIGKLTGLVEATREDITEIKGKIEKLSTLETNFRVFETHGLACQREIKQINEKLSRDYKVINDLKAKEDRRGIESNYVARWGNKFKAGLAVIVTLVGLLVSCNQLIEIREKLHSNVSVADTTRVLVTDTTKSPQIR